MKGRSGRSLWEEGGDPPAVVDTIPGLLDLYAQLPIDLP
jgi:hypothetical protein